uniref:Uncharacterized protein n=1 Tax=Arundo donax TaxID=35708 RepID=A0A0A9A9G0_ARUDO
MERSALVAEGFSKVGTRLFPRSQNGIYVPKTRTVGLSLSKNVKTISSCLM